MYLTYDRGTCQRHFKFQSVLFRPIIYLRFVVTTTAVTKTSFKRIIPTNDKFSRNASFLDHGGLKDTEHPHLGDLICCIAKLSKGSQHGIL